MAKHTPELELYPPFNGFPKEGLAFLKALKRNNNRPWFEKHKSDYENYVKLPVQCLISDLEIPFRGFGPEFDLNPKRSIFRIYRDVRFSKDKRPYKTHVAAHFVLRGKPKGISGSGYYLHIEPGEIYLGAGIYMPESDQLKKIRRAIAENPKEFLAIISKPDFKKTFGEMEGEKLVRVPAGYPADHPLAEYLKHKHFLVGLTVPDYRCLKPVFVKEVARVFQKASPLVGFLNRAIGALR
jgi:uncharacterized protein (TIGR02453 family)